MSEQVALHQKCTQTTSVTVRSVPERSVHSGKCEILLNILVLRFVSLLNQISDTMIYKPFHFVHTKTCASLSRTKIAQNPLRANVNEFSFCYSLGPESHAIHPIVILSDSIYVFITFFVSKMPNLYEKL